MFSLFIFTSLSKSFMMPHSFHKFITIKVSHVSSFLTPIHFYMNDINSVPESYLNSPMSSPFRQKEWGDGIYIYLLITEPKVCYFPADLTDYHPSNRIDLVRFARDYDRKQS